MPGKNKALNKMLLSLQKELLGNKTLDTALLRKLEL